MAFDLSKLTSLIKKKDAGDTKDGVVGVDIGSSSIKVVQLKMKGNTPTLVTYGELQLGPYGGAEIGRGTNLPVGKTTEALVDIVRESSVTSTQVALSIPYTTSFVTNITVPGNDEEKFNSVVPVEARKYIPLPLNEVSIDWFPISYNKSSNTTKLLLAAIHNQGLNKTNMVISNAGLRNLIVEIELFSTIRSSLSPKDKGVAVIDLGAGSSKLYIVRDGTISRTHSIRLGGTEMTKNLAKALNVNFERAEEIKRTSGLVDNTNPVVGKTLKQDLERGFREMHQVIERHSKNEQFSIDTIVLTGGGALTRGIDGYAQDLFQSTVRKAKPFSKANAPAFLEDTLKNVGPLFSVAIGAALRGLDEA